jgi:nucleotidyltransferase/DNA polymerase involved in DNA repair
MKLDDMELDRLEGYAAKIKDAIKQQCGLLSSIGVASTKSTAKIASRNLMDLLLFTQISCKRSFGI